MKWNQYRQASVGVAKGDEITHVAPPAKRVPLLMEELFGFLKSKNGLSWLIKAAVFDYEMEFIHPFSDGNGRMSRLWQQLILMKEDPVFEFIPIEALILKNQKEYYKALSESDRLGHSTPFVEFSLLQILSALQDYSKTISPTIQDADARLKFFKSKLGKSWFARKDYREVHKDISTATASRDLLHGVTVGLLKKRGEKNQVFYSFT